MSDSQHPMVLDTPFDPISFGPGRHFAVRTVAQTADGGVTRLPINVLRGRGDGPRLVAIGGIHGDEHDGPAALLELSRNLDPAILAGVLVILPVANPPAFRTASRLNLADGQNLNRIFPGDPLGSISHRLARLVVDEVLVGADFVLTIHGWTTGWLTVPYVEYTADYPTTAVARAGAAALGLAYLEPLALLPGRLMTHLAELGIAGCEAEIGGEGITRAERAQIAGRSVVNLMRHMGMLEGRPEMPAEQRDVARHEVRAASGGAFLRAADIELGQVVSAGQPIGAVCSLNGQMLAEVAAPADGVLACLRHALSVEPGDLLAVVFVEAPSARVG